MWGVAERSRSESGQVGSRGMNWEVEEVLGADRQVGEAAKDAAAEEAALAGVQDQDRQGLG